jgi:hypothetical protein
MHGARRDEHRGQNRGDEEHNQPGDEQGVASNGTHETHAETETGSKVYGKNLKGLFQFSVAGRDRQGFKMHGRNQKIF